LHSYNGWLVYVLYVSYMCLICLKWFAAQKALAILTQSRHFISFDRYLSCNKRAM